MKKIYMIIAAGAVLGMTAGCSEEQLETAGEGSVVITASVSEAMKVVSRSTEDIDPSTYKLWISSEKGLVRRYDGYDNIPAGAIALNTGNYIAEFWAGDSVSASFDKRWFKGREEFTVANRETSDVELVARIANVGVTVNYVDNIDDVIKDYTLTVSHDRGELLYEGREERTGFFMMPSTDKDLHYVLAGTRKDGNPFKMEGNIVEAVPGTNYILNVTYSVAESTMGGAMITIRVDETTMDYKEDISIVVPPIISGYGFDINEPLMGEAGKFTEQMINIVTASTFQEIILDSDLFLDAFDNKTSANILRSPYAIQRLKDMGVDVVDFQNDATPGHRVELIFREKFLNSLSEGEHVITIAAQDSEAEPQGSMVYFTVMVIDAAVMTQDPADVDYKTATLRASKIKEADSYGFDWREVGTAQWNHVEATVAGQTITAAIEGLTMGHTYEYVATTPDFVSSVTKSFTTLSVQLPNSGFEDWCMDGKIQRVSASAGDYFWDSGNTGSSMAGENITVPESNIKHSGKYSAKLTSKSLWGVMAAGNLFVGKFITTDGTNGILGWGRPFTETPKAVKLWAKYEPGKLKKGNTSLGVNKDDPDTGIIYIALLDNTASDTSNGETWPVIIKTKESARQLFDKTKPYVIAYGEHVFSEATAGSGLIEITIPIEYFREGVTPANIVFVASASRYGDYFIGGESTMYLDDIELIY